MKGVEIITRVENGTFKRNRSLIKQVIKQFEGKDILLKITKKRKTRSNEQNRYYWGVIIKFWQLLLIEEWGEYYTTNQTHEFLKYNCNYSEKVNEDTGEILRVTNSTTDNSTTDQEIFQEKCRRLADDMFGSLIPLPNEQMTIV